MACRECWLKSLVRQRQRAALEAQVAAQVNTVQATAQRDLQTTKKHEHALALFSKAQHTDAALEHALNIGKRPREWTTDADGQGAEEPRLLTSGQAVVTANLQKPTSVVRPTTLCHGGGGDLGHAVTFKQLQALVFTCRAEGEGEGKGEDEGKGQNRDKDKEGLYYCPSCRKALHNGMALACVRPCGHVACQACVLLGVTEHSCLVCGATMRGQGKDQLLLLQSGEGTAFAARGGARLLASGPPRMAFN